VVRKLKKKNSRSDLNSLLPLISPKQTGLLALFIGNKGSLLDYRIIEFAAKP